MHSEACLSFGVARAFEMLIIPFWSMWNFVDGIANKRTKNSLCLFYVNVSPNFPRQTTIAGASANAAADFTADAAKAKGGIGRYSSFDQRHRGGRRRRCQRRQKSARVIMPGTLGRYVGWRYILYCTVLEICTVLSWAASSCFWCRAVLCSGA